MPDNRENEEQDDVQGRFPQVPDVGSLPNAPKLNPTMPPKPRVNPSQVSGFGGVEPGGYNKMALAATAATSFIMPILVLTLGGWFLDTRFPRLGIAGIVIGLLVGFGLGVSQLLRVVKKLEE